MTTKKRVERLEEKVASSEPIEEIIIELVGMDGNITETFRVNDQGLLVEVCND